MTLKHLLLQEIENRDKTYVSELLVISGYSNLQNFKRVLTSDREFDKFQCLINLIEYIWPEKVLELIAQYSTEIDPNKKTARYMLERLSSSRNMEAFRLLLDRMKNCCNKESREWAKVYSIQYYCQENYPNVDYDDIIRQAKSFKTSIVELQIFLRLIKSSAYHQIGNYHMVKVLAEENEFYLDSIENEYLKEMYTSRLCENMSLLSLRVLSQPEKSREYVNRILDSRIGVAIKAFAYFQKGYSYLFSSYEDSLHYLNISMKLYKEMNRDWVVKDLDEKIEFLKVYHGKLEKPECHYIINYFLYNIKNGRDISKLLEEKKDEMDLPMYLYLKGYNNRNLNDLALSLIKYVRKGDSFLANLPKAVLMEMGYNEEILNEMISIRVS